MNRVYIKTYGCQMNERDSEAVAAMLRDRGYSIVDSEHHADIVLLNTCSVRDQAEQKAIGKAGHLTKNKRERSDYILGIMGCMAQNRGDELVDRIPDLDLVVGTQKFHQVPDHLDNIIQSRNGLGPRPTTIVDLDEEEGSQNTIRAHLNAERKVSAFVSIMQGCNMNCAYCIVPKTRGRERSRPIDSIVEEVHELAQAGTKEITLLGQIVNLYGRDCMRRENGKSPFVRLIESVHEVPGVERIRFTSPHPVGFRKDLIEAYRDLPKLCPYIHFPMQSGNNRVLKAMKRTYTIERYRHIVDQLREMVPDMFFSTDVIVGFPGETEDEFQDTVHHFKDIAFDMAFLFKYSIRTGTEAADMEDQIPQEEKEARLQVLLDTLEGQSLKRNQSMVGSIQEILVEGQARRGDNMFMGRTPGFRKVIFPGSDRLVGELVPLRITEASTSTLRGELLLNGVEPETNVSLPSIAV